MAFRVRHAQGPKWQDMAFSVRHSTWSKMERYGVQGETQHRVHTVRAIYEDETGVEETWPIRNMEMEIQESLGKQK
jgi:predicted oxidoreductase (fatty acid repression mutant protein)